MNRNDVFDYGDLPTDYRHENWDQDGFDKDWEYDDVDDDLNHPLNPKQNKGENNE